MDLGIHLRPDVLKASVIIKLSVSYSVTQMWQRHLICTFILISVSYTHLIGTSHGAYKFTPEQCHIDPKTGRMVPPPLAFEVLDAVMEKLPGFPIVLHGSSSVPEEEVETINKYCCLARQEKVITP